MFQSETIKPHRNEFLKCSLCEVFWTFRSSAGWNHDTKWDHKACDPFNHLWFCVVLIHPEVVGLQYELHVFLISRSLTAHQMLKKNIFHESISVCSVLLTQRLPAAFTGSCRGNFSDPLWPSSFWQDAVSSAHQLASGGGGGAENGLLAPPHNTYVQQGERSRAMSVSGKVTLHTRLMNPF